MSLGEVLPHNKAVYIQKKKSTLKCTCININSTYESKHHHLHYRLYMPQHVYLLNNTAWLKALFVFSLVNKHWFTSSHKAI